MQRLVAFSLVVGAVAGLSGCSADESSALSGLRERFVGAGGVCTSRTPFDEPRALAAENCAEGATLVVFESTQDRADFIKTELETNDNIRARTHVIVSADTWLVIDTLAVVVRVWPAMGGMISGRNGANP